MPFEKLVEDLHPARALGQNPLFEISFVFQGAGESTAVSSVTVASPFELTLFVRDRPDGTLGAYLELGTVAGTFDVAVNGRALPPVNQTTARVDIGPYIVPGRNTVTVEVATTLRNRLRVTPGFPGQAVVPRQPVGLIGPVQVIPYRQTVLHGGYAP